MYISALSMDIFVPVWKQAGIMVITDKYAKYYSETISLENS